MRSIVLTILVIIFVALYTDTAHSAEEGKCCEGQCTSEDEMKYYSIDDRTHYCGECCMKPEDYDLYKNFEKNLQPANASSYAPCFDLGYSTYLQTETHGFGQVKMTLDMYDL